MPSTPASGGGPPAAAAHRRDSIAAIGSALREAMQPMAAYSIIGTGADGRVNLFNRGAEELLGYRADEVIGKVTPEAFDAPEVLAEAQAAIRARIGRPDAGLPEILAASAAAAAAAGRVDEHEWRYVRRDGTRVPVMLSLCTLHAPDGSPAGHLGIAYDLSARYGAERALRCSEEKFRFLFEAAPLAITLHDPDDGRLIEANAAFFEMTGYDAAQLGTLTLPDVTPHAATDPAARPEAAARSGAPLRQRGVFGPIEQEWQRRDGSVFPVLLNGVRHLGPDGRRTVWSIAEDITERKRLERELRLSGHRDRLTGLPNRAFLAERLQHCQHLAGRLPGYRYAALYLDIDHFKTINDSLGHDAGDVMLQEVARRLRVALRATDAVSRESPEIAAHVGGDEFVVLLEGVRGEDDALHVAGRLARELERPYRIRDRTLRASFSVGIVADATASGRDSPEFLLRDAEAAMREAKIAGRGRHVVFDAGLRQRVRHRLEMLHDLQRAVAQRELHLVYQPVMHLGTGVVAGCEALVRWQHPVHGAVPPAEFIPMAEETGLIVDLGEWVMGAAIQQYARWRVELGSRAPRSISINLSRAQLMLDDLAPKIGQLLAAAHVEPSAVHLEITETSVMRDAEGALRTLRALRELGVKLALDDFGTGYSSLASLHQLPLDAIKIDRSFVSRLPSDRVSAALIEAVMSLARVLDLEVVAEGIETPRELELLQAIGCHMGQGYLFTRPLPPAEFAAFLRAGASATGGAAAGTATDGASATGARGRVSRP